MGLGREVADAYISVHGDLSPFRKDLEGAAEAGRQAAIENADAFSEEWGKRMERDVGKQWHNVVDAMYKNDKISWERLLGDTSSIDKIDEKFTDITDLMSDMVDEGKLLDTQFNDIFDTMSGIVDKMKDRAEIEQDYGDAVKENLARDQLRLRVMTDAHEENKRWARTFEGMTKNNGLAAMERDFRAIAEATRSTDWSKFIKGFDGVDGAAGRVRELNQVMLQQGRISEDNADLTAASIDQYIDGQKRMALEERRALDHAAALLEAQQRYKRSLDGMVDAHHFARMEDDFRELSAAMATNDWRVIQRASVDVDDFRRRTYRVSSALRSMGRMSDDAFISMQRMVRHASRGTSALQLGLRSAGEAAGRFVTRMNLGARVISVMGRAMDSVVGKVKGLAGFNVVADVFRQGGAFIQNLDRNAVKIAKMMTAIGALGSVIVPSLAGATTIIGDLSAAIGGLAAMAPAYLIGTAIGAGVLVAAFKDMKTVLADLKPKFADLQDIISKKFWKQAAEPIRDMVNGLLPTLKTQLGNTATAFGGVFAKLATAIDKVPKKDIVTMFERMNRGIEIAGGAMAPLVNAFKNLGLAGSKTFERFGKWIVDISKQFDRFIEKSAKNGDLDKWINNAIEAMKDLGRVIYNVDGIFRAMGDAARAAGSKGLDGFANSLENIHKVMDSPRFQAGLKTFFEAFYIGLEGVKQGFLNLAPGVEAFLPTLKTIMGSLAEVFEKIGTIASTFLQNKALQDGMKKFADGISKALDNLMPAIGPMANSLGQVFDLMALVLPNITDIIAKIATTWGPIFDKMLETLKPLIPPLTEFVKKIIEDLQPVFKTFVDEVLPPLVDLFKELLPIFGGIVKLLTPVIVALFEGFAIAFKEIAAALKEFNIWAGPAGEKLGKIIDQMNTMKNVDTGKGAIMDNLFKFAFSAATQSKTIAAIGRWFDGITSGLRQNIAGFLSIVTGLFNPDNIVKALMGFSIGFVKFGDEFDTNVQKFFDSIPGMIKERWEGMWRGLTDWYRDVKKNFQDFMSGLLGFETGSEGSHGTVVGGGKGSMGVSGKFDPAMFGLPTEESTKSWFENFGTSLREGFTAALASLGEVLGLNDFGTRWNEFWGTLPVKVQETWDAVLLWTQTKFAEIKLTIDTWIADAKLNWDNFWNGARLKVEEIWNAVTTWIQTKVGEIKTNLTTFATEAKLNWDNFWNGMKLKVEEIWNAVKTWIDTKVREIKTNVENFTRDVKTNWDNFWNGVRDKVTNIWNEITNWINTKVGQIKTNIANFGRDVKTNWDNFWNGVKTKVDNIWNEMKSAVERKSGEVIEFVRGMPQKITNQFSNMWGEMERIGGSIWQGLKQGIENGLQWVQDAARNLAASAIAAAKMALEVNSPSKAFRRLGLSGGEGMGQGFDWSQGLVGAAAADMANAAVDAVASFFAHSKMYVAGADAALALAAGLKDNKGAALDAFGALLPPEAGISLSASGVGAGGAVAAGGKIINIHEGAINVVTPTEDPKIVAEKTIDELVINSNL